jgi:hypothetical protein
VRIDAAKQAPRYFTVATLAVSASRLLDDTGLRCLTWLARRADIEDGALSSAPGLRARPG